MDILKEFQAAIEIEHLKNIQEFEEQNNLPLDERIAKGISIANFQIEIDFYDNAPNQWCRVLTNPEKYIRHVKVICDNNISKFKEGNSVLLSNGMHKFEMDIDEDSPEKFILKPNDFNVKHCYIDSVSYPTNNWEINLVKSDIGTKLLKTAAQILIEDETTLRKIDAFLNGKTTNEISNYTHTVGYLNESQNSAYLKAINRSNFCIIQGPPGTGKTETIANIAKYFIDEGLKVFITAPTHTAINNCMNAISSKVKNGNRVIKIGERPQNREVQFNEHVTKKTRLSYNSSGYKGQGVAIGATAYSLCYPSTRRLDGWEFDVTIVDEASQLSIPLSIAAMCRTGKYIFVGDHKQLDPIIPKKSNNEMFAESVFSRLARLYPKDISLLNVSYRLNESLIKIPNVLFYNNRLSSDLTTTKDNRTYNSINHSQILNNDAHTLVLHNTFDAQGRSPFESKLTAEIVKDLLENGASTDKIGIMSPYRAQVREIKKELRRTIPKSLSQSLDSLFVDTVDSMQGQERDYIIYSMSNSHPLESMRRLDFFYSPNRLNVAITRAIKKCIVIANYKIFDIKDEELDGHHEYNDIKPNLYIFKKYHSLSSKVEKYQVEKDVW